MFRVYHQLKEARISMPQITALRAGRYSGGSKGMVHTLLVAKSMQRK